MHVAPHLNIDKRYSQYAQAIRAQPSRLPAPSTKPQKEKRTAGRVALAVGDQMRISQEVYIASGKLVPNFPLYWSLCRYRPYQRTRQGPLGHTMINGIAKIVC